MMNRPRLLWTTAWLLLPLAPTAAGAQLAGPGRPSDLGATAGRAVGVSPGGPDGFVPGAGPCPTFSWTAAAGASGYQLRVFRVGDLQRAEAVPALAVALPAGASSWTPPGDRCLAAGERYAWSVRALGGATGDRGETGGWSEALLFAVPTGPSAAEVEAALRVLQAYLEGGIEPEASVVAAAAASSLPEDSLADRPTLPVPPEATGDGAAGGPPVAVYGEVPDAAGETYGVRGVSNSPDGSGVRADNNSGSGADLLLGGSPAAKVNETGFTRDSASNLSFDFSNPGTGTMTLRVDGTEVIDLNQCPNQMIPKSIGGAWVCSADNDANYSAGNQLNLVGTTFHVVEGAASDLDADLLDSLDSTAFLAAGTDDWVDESGDTMTGALAMSGNAINSVGDIALNDTSTVTKGGARFLWDLAGSGNFSAGRGALGANTSGTSNTAIGSNALLTNTTGGANTAVGHNALNSNTLGGGNTAVGFYALQASTVATSNTAVGLRALEATTTGAQNTALGSNALRFNTTADGNTAVGFQAMVNNTTGTNNTAVGNRALQFSTASGNTAVGFQALTVNTGGAENTAVGRDALASNTTESRNTAVGFYALRFNTQTNNTAVGARALTYNSTGQNNTAVGSYALRNNSLGGSNTAVGNLALQSNSSAGSNTAVGDSALLANTTGVRNVAVGRAALFANTTAHYNTALGAYALDANTTGYSNVAVGINALGANTTGISNIGIGPSAGVNLTTGNNNIVIGNVGVAGESGRIRIGNTQSETFIAGINGNVTAGGVAVLVNASGELGTSVSSRRFKEDIRHMGEASERLYDLEPVTFRYKEEMTGPGPRPREYGLVAEEVAQVLPELVVLDEDGRPYTVRYDQLTPMLVNELQRLRRELERHAAELDRLRRRLGERSR